MSNEASCARWGSLMEEWPVPFRGQTCAENKSEWWTDLQHTPATFAFAETDGGLEKKSECCDPHIGSLNLFNEITVRTHQYCKGISEGNISTKSLHQWWPLAILLTLPWLSLSLFHILNRIILLIVYLVLWNIRSRLRSLLRTSYLTQDTKMLWSVPNLKGSQSPWTWLGFLAHLIPCPQLALSDRNHPILETCHPYTYLLVLFERIPERMEPLRLVWVNLTKRRGHKFQIFLIVAHLCHRNAVQIIWNKGGSNCITICIAACTFESVCFTNRLQFTKAN